MNKFKEYVTGSSFSISLSKKQIDTLCMMLVINELNLGISDTKHPIMISHLNTLHFGTIHSLEDKGLIEWKKDSCGRNNGAFVTQAGKIVISLLREAELYPRWIDNEISKECA